MADELIITPEYVAAEEDLGKHPDDVLIRRYEDAVDVNGTPYKQLAREVRVADLRSENARRAQWIENLQNEIAVHEAVINENSAIINDIAESKDMQASLTTAFEAAQAAEAELELAEAPAKLGLMTEESK